MGTALAMECWLGEQLRSQPLPPQSDKRAGSWLRRWLRPAGLRRTQV
jgi:hypothetical protein